uniref:Uncharacterized protein n=1 Tax=viral metagenome TaxID=1070528 RepID=A0A6H1ZVG7_9ZZZZ
MQAVTGKELGLVLCKIFDQPVDRVQSVTVTAEASGMASVMISRLVTEEEAASLATLFEYFGLVKTSEYRQEHPQGFEAGAVATDDWSKIAREALGGIEEVPDGS